MNLLIKAQNIGLRATDFGLFPVSFPIINLN